MVYKRQIGRLPIVPADAKHHNVTCHYCIVGCGYKVYTWDARYEGGTDPKSNAFGVNLGKQQVQDTEAWYAPSMYKLGSIAAIRVENAHFENRISLLTGAATPRKLDMREFGAKDCAGIFYQLAEGFDFTAFAASEWNNAAAAAVPGRLKRLTAPWSTSVPETQKTIGEIRERVLWPDDFNKVVEAHGLDWVGGFEARPAQTVWCVVHGDLHGENALVSADGTPVLIDYGDVDLGPRSLDPISLEFSLLFHPKSPLVNGPWPSDAQARRWFDLEAYLQDCPVPEFVHAARQWAIEAAAGRRELAATAYAYFVRQLKFSTTDGHRALALLEGCRALYDTT